MSHSLHWTVLLLDEHDCALWEKHVHAFHSKNIHLLRKYKLVFTKRCFSSYGKKKVWSWLHARIVPLGIRDPIIHQLHNRRNRSLLFLFRGFWRNVSLYRQIALIQLMRLKRGVKLFTLGNWPRKPSEGDN